MKGFMKKTKPKIKVKLNKKKLIVLILVLLLIISVIVMCFIYAFNKDFKNWTDKNILNKEVIQENTSTININSENTTVCAYGDYIGVLANNSMQIYNVLGKKEDDIIVKISKPIYDTKGKYIAIAENDGQKAYLVQNKEIVWEKETEGNIAQIIVNKNGYVAIVVINTSYKTIIEMYNPKGEELFKTYLSSTRAADVTISNDNKYMAIAEIDTSGTMIQSTTKIVSVKNAQENPSNSIVNIYKAEAGRLITNINYQERENLLCMYTDGISIIKDNKEEVISTIDDKKVTFSSIDLDDSSIMVEEKTSGLFTADSELQITNSDSKGIKTYTTNEVTKEIYVCSNVIGMNIGTEIDFVNKDGWLKKRYLANQEITNVVISDVLAGIIYRDKIEIVLF